MRLSSSIPEFLQISVESAYIGSMNSATISELFLVAACGLSGRACRKIPGPAGKLAPASFLIVGLTALAGALRYGGLTSITAAHLWLSPLAGIALSALGGCFLMLSRPEKSTGAVAYTAIVGIGLGCYALEPDLPWRLGLNIIGITLVLLGATFRSPFKPQAAGFSIAAVGTLVVAGIGIGTQGMLWGLERLDLFHLVMACSVSLHAVALRTMAPR